MDNKTIIKIIAGGAILALLAWLLFGYFGIQALWMDRTVNDQVPTVRTSTQSVLSDTVTSTTEDTGPRFLTQGTFQKGDSTYSISGTATVTEEHGARTLSLTDFEVTNGPDLFVYLIPIDSAGNQSVKAAVSAGTFINLGELKGNKGNQTYLLPADLDLSKEYVVSIWCRRFARNFGAALLPLPAQK